MNKPKYLAWILVLSFVLSVFCTSQPVAYAADDVDDTIVLSERNMELIKGSSSILYVKNLGSNQSVSFKSSDTSVATVSDESNDRAKITASGIGIATITVKIKEKKMFFSHVVDTLECDILVGPPALSIKCKRSSLQMNVGQKKKLSYTIKPSNTTEMPVFKSDAPSVVSVSSNGRLAAKKLGKATISISIANGNSSSCVIIVSEGDESEEKE